MANLTDLQNAKDKLIKIMELRDNLIGATPMLTSINDNLSWYEKAYNQLSIDNAEKLLNNIDTSLLNLNQININPFSYAPLTGATGSFAAASAETRNILVSDGNHYDLIKEYEDINAIENQFDQAFATINKVDHKLATFLEEAKKSFQLWKGDVRNDSDLAKDVRSFQDLFKGFLNYIRMTADGKKTKDFSWPKMAEAISKPGAGSLQRLRAEQSTHERLHTAFTEIFKGTRTCADKNEMENYVADYLKHLLIILGSVRGDLLGL